MEKLPDDNTQPRAHLRAQAIASMDAILVKPIRFPSEESLSNTPERMSVWLRLASEVQESIAPVEAIRNYYAIWEDIRGRPEADDPVEAFELKYVRDFVSHGEELRNQDLLDFIESKLEEPATQYDPLNKKHAKFLKSFRETARKLVTNELETMLYT